MTKQNDKLDEILAGVNEGKEESRKTREMVAEMMAMLCKRYPQLKMEAQSKAAELWRRYRYSMEIGCEGRKNTFADVFEYCKRELDMLGIKNAVAFRRAVKNDQKNASRCSKSR